MQVLDLMGQVTHGNILAQIPVLHFLPQVPATQIQVDLWVDSCYALGIGAVGQGIHIPLSHETPFTSPTGGHGCPLPPIPIVGPIPALEQPQPFRPFSLPPPRMPSAHPLAQAVVPNAALFGEASTQNGPQALDPWSSSTMSWHPASVFLNLQIHNQPFEAIQQSHLPTHAQPPHIIEHQYTQHPGGDTYIMQNPAHLLPGTQTQIVAVTGVPNIKHILELIGQERFLVWLQCATGELCHLGIFNHVMEPLSEN